MNAADPRSADPPSADPHSADPHSADPRAVLARVVRERGEDYANLSRLLGRNAAYIQQFISRGSPRKLDEEDRIKLARYFGIDERLLGGPAVVRAMVDRNAMVSVPRLALHASAGPGALPGDEAAVGSFAFDERWLRQVAHGSPADMSIIRVTGDSMAPTLVEGDDILVDASDAGGALRDGIYVLRRDDALSVKRLALNPAGRRVTIKSDNPAYRDFADVKLSAIAIIGRVVWAGRRLG